ncbi:MAG: cold shock domain-containing protein [Alcanivoracaceae bacterium]|jgi:CspA family cold shock protein|nr:cold shock domain-containing protein [Alcanivoracaceae bacterium]
MEKFITVLFFAFFALFAAAGIWVLVDPQAAIISVHGEHQVKGASVLLTRQTAMGLLLAAAVNLFCALRTEVRPLLHLAVLLYLAGLVASHGQVALGSGAIMWAAVAIYALPLLLRILRTVPVPDLPDLPVPSLGSKERRGEVKWFNPNKGFGFLVTPEGDEIFVHFKAVKNGGRRSLRQGQQVRFTTRQTERGEQADEVTIERQD